MNAIVKKVGIILLSSSILVGVFSGYHAIGNYLDSKIAIERGKYEAISAEYDDYKNEAKKRLNAMSFQVKALQSEKMKYVKDIDQKTVEIMKKKSTITDLEKARENLDSAGDIIYNQDLQIQEYKKLVYDYEQRFLSCKNTIITQEEIIKRCVKSAQEFEQLYLKEEQLNKMMKNRLKLSEQRLGWEKLKFKGSTIVAVAAGGFILYNEITRN